MIAESNLVVSWRARPRGFVALMGLYESNYLRLAAMAGDLSSLAASRVSEVPGDCTLVLNVLARARFTSELLLSYLLPAGAASPVLERVPDQRLRVYHDARLLEACPADDAPAHRDLGRRWSRNMMLNKWLDYCAERGHRFIHD
ncbi:MAG TPA: DUF1249 domain-containing protein [Steroidobacteraceae bacterium]|nr:DUF1249 domain-containing protein [Steroidobacteraceae bacterium]